MDTKEIVNSLIEDITNDAAISHILLKAQIIALVTKSSVSLLSVSSKVIRQTMKNPIIVS